MYNQPFYRYRPFADPAVGAELSITPDPGEGWLITSLRFRLAAANAGAPREVHLTRVSGVGTHAQYGPATTQGINTTFTYASFAGMVKGSTGATFIPIDCPAMGFWLPHGHSLVTATVGLNAADQYGLVQVEAFVYPNGPERRIFPIPAAISGIPVPELE